MPSTNLLCSKKNMRMVGKVAMTIATMITPYSGKYADDREDIMSVMVFCPSDCKTISGHKKLFQLVINAIIPAAAKVERMVGI